MHLESTASVPIGQTRHFDAEKIKTNIPPALKSARQWVAWRLGKRDGEVTKLPYKNRPGYRLASSTDPATWTLFDVVLRGASQMRDHSQPFGVGFVFTERDDFFCIDLDKVRDPASGVIEPWAAEIVRAFNTFTEVSQSGRGIHIVGIGRKPWPACRHYQNPQLEVYSEKRFLAVTGDRLAGTPAEVRDCQAELDDLFERHFSHRKPRPRAAPIMPLGTTFVGVDDRELIEHAEAHPRYGSIFSQLRAGNHGGDHSAAVLSYCNRLAHLCGPDHQRIDRLFRESGLNSGKWLAGKWDRLGEETIDKAIDGCSRFFDWDAHREKQRKAAEREAKAKELAAAMAAPDAVAARAREAEAARAVAAELDRIEAARAAGERPGTEKLLPLIEKAEEARAAARGSSSIEEDNTYRGTPPRPLLTPRIGRPEEKKFDSDCRRMKLLMSHREDPTRVLFLEKRCDHHSCHLCKKPWEEARLWWYGQIVEQWPEHYLVTAAAAEGRAPSESRNVSKQIDKLKAKGLPAYYVRIPDGSADTWITSHPVKGARKVTPAEALRALEAIRGVPEGKKVTSTRALAFSQSKEPPVNKWDVVCSLSRFPRSKILQAFDETGLRITHCKESEEGGVLKTYLSNTSGADVLQVRAIVDQDFMPPLSRLQGSEKATAETFPQKAFVLKKSAAA
jgi:hypothetical protein